MHNDKVDHHRTCPYKLWVLKSESIGYNYCWCFEPCQPQRIILGLKTNFNLSPSYSFHESHVSFSQTTTQIISTISERKPRKSFGVYLESAGTQKRNRHQLSATMSRVTCFILRAHTGTGVSHRQHRKNSQEV